MEQMNDALGMLDLLALPGFCVKDKKIVKLNPLAACRQIPMDADVTKLLLTGSEEYAEFRDGCLYLTLELEGQPWGASVTRIGEYHVFLLEAEHERTELQALALSARELREPLSGIMTIADRLFPKTVQHDPALQDQISLLNRGLFRILRIIGNMSDAGRVPAPNLHQETLDITAFLSEVFEKARELVQHAQIRLTYEGPQSPIFCLVDSELLERAILNILSNAIKFTPKDGKIEAKLVRRNKKLYLTIRDNGSGIPENLRGNIYTRYLRQPTLEDGRYGIGLGLAIVRNAASQHGGTVLIDHPEDQGTRVTMTMAITQSKDPMVRTPLLHVDYAGGRDRGLIELSDCLPNGVYDTNKVN